eukprot:205517-Pyramimonas_sp.AAC.1
MLKASLRTDSFAVLPCGATTCARALGAVTALSSLAIAAAYSARARRLPPGLAQTTAAVLPGSSPSNIGPWLLP